MLTTLKRPVTPHNSYYNFSTFKIALFTSFLLQLHQRKYDYFGQSLFKVQVRLLRIQVYGYLVDVEQTLGAGLC